MKIKKIVSVILFIIVILTFSCSTVYGNSTNINKYKPEKPNNSLVYTDNELEGPIVSIRIKLIKFIFIILIYFIPTMISLIRKHTYKLYIICINILLGWTGIGWLGCLIWSLIDNKNK